MVNQELRDFSEERVKNRDTLQCTRRVRKFDSYTRDRRIHARIFHILPAHKKYP